MWSDNEAEVDLLGYGHLADAVVGIVKNEDLLPATIGLFGDWGSGKSTLLRMVGTRLEDDDKTLVLPFNGWLFEGYADARASLMGSILDSLTEKKTLGTKAKDLVVKLFRRLDILRIGTRLGKYGLSYAIGGTTALGITAGADAGETALAFWDKAKDVKPEDLKEFLKDDPGRDARQGIAKFRQDFEELLKAAEIERLIVTIDDLDRCLPDTVIETLEAIKFFLFVRGSAFILAADDRLVQYAVRRCFPELPGERRDVGRDYLEKLIQFPVRVPPLGAPETENYVNLLLAQASNLSGPQFEMARARVVNPPDGSLLEVRFNLGIARELFDSVTPELEERLAVAHYVAPILASGLAGNPRQCKRFLNTLLLRQSMAEARDIELKLGVLAVTSRVIL